MPYLYFLKGGAILSEIFSFNGVVDIGEGEYFILDYDVELRVDENSLPIFELYTPVYVGRVLGIP